MSPTAEPAVMSGKTRVLDGTAAHRRPRGDAKIDRMMVDVDPLVPNFETRLGGRLREAPAGHPEGTPAR